MILTRQVVCDIYSTDTVLPEMREDSKSQKIGS